MYSLKIRFIFVFVLIVLSLALLSFVDSKVLEKINNAHEKIQRIQETHISLLQMRRAEKDFFARKDIKYHNKLLSIANVSKANLKAFGLKKNLVIYIEKFENISKHMQILGLTNDLESNKEFFLHTKRLERNLIKDRDTNILLAFLKMRQHEKDFFLYKDIKYLKLHRDMMKEIKHDPSVKTHTDILLDNYNVAFINLKTRIQLEKRHRESL